MVVIKQICAMLFKKCFAVIINKQKDSSALLPADQGLGGDITSRCVTSQTYQYTVHSSPNCLHSVACSGEDTGAVHGAETHGSTKPPRFKPF